MPFMPPSYGIASALALAYVYVSNAFTYYYSDSLFEFYPKAASPVVTSIFTNLAVLLGPYVTPDF